MTVLRRFRLLDLDFLIVQGTKKSLLDLFRFVMTCLELINF
jgi:hypothetical protein